MAKVNVTIRIDKDLKTQADELFSDFGLSLNTAINLFLKQTVREQRIPFEITRKITSFAPDSLVNKVSDELIVKNEEAYKDLAK